MLYVTLPNMKQKIITVWLCLAGLEDKVDGPSPDSSDVLRGSDIAENNASDTKQVKGDSLLLEGDAGKAESIPAAETDAISGITPATQPFENISPETVIGDGNTEDHQEQPSNVPNVALKEPSLVQKTEEQAVRVAESEYEEYEEICNRLLNQEISSERALRLLDLSVKMSYKCSQIVNSAVNSSRK